MTLLELTEVLLPGFPTSMQKDVHTSVRILAQAIGASDPAACPLERCAQPRASLLRLVEDLLVARGKGAHTIRNMKNCVSRLFRLADAHGLLALPPSAPRRRFLTTHRHYAKRGYQATVAHDGSYLRRHDWPPALEADFARFERWATDPVVDGREAKWRKRWTTLDSYQQTFEAYFGYLKYVHHLDEPSFDHLFDIHLIQSFLYWHINEKHRRPTVFSHRFMKNILALTRQYRGDQALLIHLKALAQRLPRPTPTYEKSEVWLSLPELDRIGLALWPVKSPHQLRQLKSRQAPGGFLAARAGLSLMFRLWVHIPYRSRNIREMRVGEQLYQTPEGQWRIRFSGNGLKTATRRGQPNVFDLPFPPSLVPTLEAYLRDWHPILANRHHRRELFLLSNGHTYSAKTLRLATQRQIFIFTGKPWHPHIVRTVWATEWIQSGGDFMTAAIMLGNTLEIMIKKYAHLLEENVAEKAFAWVQGRVNGH